MIKILRKNSGYSVELHEDTGRIHQPHRSWGIYRVIEAARGRVIFATPNRDKSLGVFEYLTQEAGL